MRAEMIGPVALASRLHVEEPPDPVEQVALRAGHAVAPRLLVESLAHGFQLAPSLGQRLGDVLGDLGPADQHVHELER